MADSNTSKFIDTQKVKDCSGAITRLNDDLRNKYLAAFEAAMASTTGYASEAATELMDTFNELKPKFDTHYQMIKAKADFLQQQVAERHETIVTGQKQTISGLKPRE